MAQALILAALLVGLLVMGETVGPGTFFWRGREDGGASMDAKHETRIKQSIEHTCTFTG